MNEEILFLAFRPLLFKYLKMLYLPEIEFEDFKQEGELALLEVLRRYDPNKGELSGYVKKALYYSLKRVRNKLLKKELLIENFLEISDDVIKEEDFKVVDLSQLSPRERQIITLIYYSNCSEREVASYLGISRNSVKIYKKRAIKKLKI